MYSKRFNPLDMNFTTDTKIAKVVKIWLITGLVMIFIQVVIGGITRLTGSGLSITKWEIVTGTLPPMGEAAWQEAFDLYKQTPQYAKINLDMGLGDFKFIYFWEYFHRLWARLMFGVFIVPFFWFLYRGMLTRRLMLRLLVVVALAGLEGFFGWIMVASGLIKRPWVNAYNLTLHLTTALVIFAYLLWTTYIAVHPTPESTGLSKGMRRFTWWMVIVAFVQIALGAMMSGSKAGLAYPTWPDMNGVFLPDLLLDGSQWQSVHFIDYDTNGFMPSLLQFLHRNTAYLLSGMVLYFWWQSRDTWSVALQRTRPLLLATLLAQVLLGIFTLIHCKGSVPVALGVAHQAGAVVLLSVLVFTAYAGGREHGGVKST
jgi:heme a synthase